MYWSGDVDLAIERLRRDAMRLEGVFKSLGFQSRGRHWRFGALFVELPNTTLSDPSEFMRVGSAVFEIVKKEVVLADRIIRVYQWRTLVRGQFVDPSIAVVALRATPGRLLNDLNLHGVAVIPVATLGP